MTKLIRRSQRSDIIGISAVGIVLTVSISAAVEPHDSASAHLATPKQYEGPSFSCQAITRMDRRTIALGSTLTIACELRCTGGVVQILNGVLDDRIRLPAEIVIVSADGRICHKLLSDQEVRKRKCDAWDWVSLGGDQAVGREFVFQIGRSTRTDMPRGQMLDLPPGEYYAQSRYNYWAIAPPKRQLVGQRRRGDASSEEPQAIPPYSDAQMDLPLAISECVKFVVNADATIAADAGRDGALVGELTLVQNRIKLGRQAQLEVKFVNRSKQSVELYNPQLSGLLSSQRAAFIDCIAADGTLIGDLLVEQSGSSRPPSRADWARLPPGGFFTSRVVFRAGSVPGTEFDGARELTPGRYSLQLRLNDAISAGCPQAIKGSADGITASGLPGYSDWVRSFPGKEVWRSDPVEIEFQPRTGD